ncbi:hypothetical protein LSH36_811g00029 [Paralvinella palmiformis]|uniref:protein-tyrosine-phosphatase n=1 Tax=Paralvinella palmiformis TaxID=53620 RepID=A0AAD9IZF1_9ANNE|nr:hypothetical protein LSH36_811g00029 [Paralvinella palmiformis]
MIWQYNANRIVMVANLVEGGRRMCDSYWPEEINQSEKHEEFIVTLESVVEYADYIVRSLKLRKQLHYGQDESRPIYQYHFTSWKDRGRPSFGAVTLLHFHQEVHSKDDERTGPLVVHCSAGVGRTGTFIALDILLQQVEHERVVDVFGCIQKLREQRMLMVQSQEQAMFLHDAILEAINVGNTSYPCSTMAEEFSKICEEKENGKSELRKQFMLLSKLKSTPEEQINGRVLEESKDKNRDISVIPGELDRPYLTIRHEYQSDYINAVYVDSFRKHDYYVVTQMPLPNTQADFWRLVFDHQLNAIVMLNEMDESDEVYFQVATCKQYWPDGGSGIYGPIKVEHVAVTNISTNIVMRQFMVSLATNKFLLFYLVVNKKNDGKLSVRHYQLLGWPNNEVLPPDKDVLLLLMEEVHSWQQKQKYPKHIHKMGHTIVHCLNGVTRCGLFCGVSYIIDKIKLDEKVDVLLAARNVSRNRYQFVRTLDEYRFLYEIALKYIYWCVC